MESILVTSLFGRFLEEKRQILAQWNGRSLCNTDSTLIKAKWPTNVNDVVLPSQHEQGVVSSGRKILIFLLLLEIKRADQHCYIIQRVDTHVSLDVCCWAYKHFSSSLFPMCWLDEQIPSDRSHSFYTIVVGRRVGLECVRAQATESDAFWQLCVCVGQVCRSGWVRLGYIIGRSIKPKLSP